MRLTEGYLREFDIDFEYGRQGELLVGDIVEQIGSGQARLEVKRSSFADDKLYVEVEQKPRGQTDYKPSGLKVTTAEYWVFVKPGPVLLFVTAERLKACCRAAYARGERAIDGGLNGDNPTKGYLLKASEIFTRKAAS